MKHIRIFSVLLALILAFSSLPLSVIAENTISFYDKNQVILDQNFTTETTDESDNVFIVQEDTTKRGEFEKHYICSDGTYVVASYAEAIHYKDDNGEWADVDNRPVQTTAGDYTTRNGDFGISVPSSTSDGHLMRMDKGEHSLSWTLSANKKAGTIKMDSNVSTMAQKPVQSQKMQVGATKRPEIIVSNTEQPLENHKILRDEATFELPNVSGKVRYDDLFGADEGVSVVYTTYRNKIEEDIYIEKPTDITSFSMEVVTPDLTPRLNADNSVDFLDNDGKMCYHVGIPYMMDADFAVLNDIETTVIRSGDIWVITYTPDAEWFTSEERVYPILLDPSITTNEYRTNMQDTYVEEEDNTVHSSEQLLYINGGTGNRKAVIRFLTLPAIDDTMPLISASLTLYSQYSSSSDVSLKLSYSRDNISTSIGSYTYEKAINAGSLYTCYSTLMTGSTVAFFDLTNCIYDMYESGTDDLILGYSNDNDTTYCYPFHSVETTTSYKPTLKIYYGYSLPTDKIGDGKIISIQNYGSLDYMTAMPNEGSNIYQFENDDWNPTSHQKFRLEKVSATGGYRLYPYTSNSKVVGVEPFNGYVYGTKNVALYDVGETNTQEWLFVPVSYYEFRIVSRTNMTKCLSAYNDDNGSPSTTTTTASGNIYSKTIEDGNDYQLWWLYDDENKDISLDHAPANITTGDYYIINQHTGRYMFGNGNISSTVYDRRDFMSNIGEANVGWHITNLGDGYCTIQSLSGMYYLGYRKTAAGNKLTMTTLPQGITDYFKWYISVASGGGMLLKNKSCNQNITSGNLDEDSFVLELHDLDAISSDKYKKQTWRMVSQNDYDEYAQNDNQLSFPALTLNVGESTNVSVNNPSNYDFSTSSDFIYKVNHEEYISFCENIAYAHKSNKRNYDEILENIDVTAIHKTTGGEKTFSVEIDKAAIIIIPGFMGSELFLGGDNDYFYHGTPIFKAEMISCIDLNNPLDSDFSSYAYWSKATYSNLEYCQNIVNSLLCTNDGESKYEVFVKDYDPTCDQNDMQNYLKTNNCGTGNVYEPLYTHLKDTYPEYEIKFFSYDWRLSCDDSGDSLYNYIEDREYGKVQFVAHSMGGLVLSSYLKKLNQSNNTRIAIGECVYLGSPLFGTAEVVHILANESVENLLTNLIPADVPEIALFALHLILEFGLDSLCCNFPSVYDELPSAEYFARSPYDVIKYNGTSINNSYSIAIQKWQTAIPHFKHSLLDDAIARRNSLYVNGIYISNYYSSHYYYADDHMATTITVDINHNIITGTSSSATQEFKGDSIVAYWSAYPIDAPQERLHPEDTNHMLLLNEFIDEDGSDHIFN